MSRIDKRTLLKRTAGAVGMGGLVGCLGGDGSDGTEDGGTDEDGSDGTEESPTSTPEEELWDPVQDIVTYTVGVTPGSTRDIIARAWADATQPHYPEGTTTAVENNPGAEGRIAMQDLHSGPPTGDLVGLSFLDEPFLLAQDAPDVETSDFEWIGSLYSTIRGICVSQNSRDLDRHFQWNWEDFVASAKEEPFTIGVVIPLQELAARFVFDTSDELTEGEDYSFVTMDSGSEVRTAVERGDVDIYPESFSGGYFTERDQFYKVQMAYANPETNPDLVETLSNEPSHDGTVDGVPESGYIVNQDSIDDEVANLAVAATYNEAVLGAPPNTPEEVLNIHRDAGEAAQDADRVLSTIDDVLSRPMYNPVFESEHVESLFTERKEFTTENELYEELIAKVDA